jgi:fructosamine-3-kinase
LANSIQEIAAVSNIPLQEQNPILLPSEGRVAKQKVKGVNRYYFLKTGSINDLPLLISEKIGLEALALVGAVKVPKVFFLGETSTCSFLICEYLDLNKDNLISGEILGKQLALLHQNSNECFGLNEDNWIGLNPQKNHWHENWISFFKKYRLQPQLTQAFERGYRANLEKKADRLMEILPLFFDQYKPKPSLLHGDLWSGNWGTINNTTPVVFDPAIYYGDRETDLAMTKLFGGFPQAFYDAYNYQWTLDYGFKVRQNLYNLYHLLNHLNLFGEVYLRQTIDVLEQLLSEI